MSSENGVRAPAVPTPWGPQTVPEIPCGSCGTGHHPDATTGEERGQCRGCGAFLRRPTEAEMRRFTDFIVWKSHWMEVENSRQLSTGSSRHASNSEVNDG